MSVFSLKIDIADNKFFNGETSPLFASQAKLARQFHQKIAGYRPAYRFVRWTISQACLV